MLTSSPSRCTSSKPAFSSGGLMTWAGQGGRGGARCTVSKRSCAGPVAADLCRVSPSPAEPVGWEATGLGGKADGWVHACTALLRSLQHDMLQRQPV